MVRFSSTRHFRLAALLISTVFPAVIVAQGLLAANPSPNPGTPASGINPDYLLPSYSPNSAPATSAGSTKSAVAEPPRAALPAPSKEDPSEDREVSWHKLPMNILHDQKNMWLFPLELGKGRHWLPALFITGGTAAFLATDAQTMPHFRQTTGFHGFNRVFSTTATGAAIADVPAVFYAASFCCAKIPTIRALRCSRAKPWWTTQFLWWSPKRSLDGNVRRSYRLPGRIATPFFTAMVRFLARAPASLPAMH